MMKSNKLIRIFIGLLCLISLNLKSQSLIRLDNKRSFKDFKIGDLYQKWATTVQLTKEDGIFKQYVYTGECCKTIFDLSVGNIGLIFRNGKLVLILVEVDKIETKDFKKSVEDYGLINQSFEMLFSKPTSYNDNEYTSVSLYSWQTKRTILATKYSPIPNSDGYEIKVFIADRSYFTGKINTGF